MDPSVNPVSHLFYLIFSFLTRAPLFTSLNLSLVIKQHVGSRGVVLVQDTRLSVVVRVHSIYLPLQNLQMWDF